MIKIDVDAFSSGQISSKIWLCETLESMNWQSKLTQIYGGWYGLTAFLLLSRGIFNVKRIESFDIDPSCQPIADVINENWVWQNWKFKAHTKDCNFHKESFGDLIINTSTEHFLTRDWFENIPNGTRLILQGNNMKHQDHTINFSTLNDFINYYPLKKIEFSGEKHFTYPTWSFTRFMIIGHK